MKQHIANANHFLTKQLLPSIWYFIETMLHGSVLIALCVVCFGFGFFANMEVPQEAPRTLTEFCENVVNPKIKGKHRMTYLRQLIDEESPK